MSQKDEQGSMILIKARWSTQGLASACRGWVHLVRPKCFSACSLIMRLKIQNDQSTMFGWKWSISFRWKTCNLHEDDTSI